MNRKRGFTLIELVITIALMAILLVVAVPGMRNLIQDNKMAAQANDVVTAVNTARLEAIKRNRPVSLCVSDDASTCGSGDWQDGWMVYVDGDAAGSNNTSIDAANGGVIRVWQPGQGFADVAPNPADLDFLRFLPNGRIDVAALSGTCGSGEAICFVLDIEDGTECRGGRRMDRRLIDISTSGRTTVNFEDCP